MPNHYHLVLETPEPNLVAMMAWLQSTYTIRLNHRHRLFGHVLSGRSKSQLVEGSGSGYLRRACDNVPLNPVRARGPKAGERASRLSVLKGEPGCFGISDGAAPGRAA